MHCKHAANTRTGRNRKRPAGRLAGIVLLASAACSGGAGWAQGTTATLSGTVTDTSGAVVPNATVTLINEQSGDKRTSRSNGSGVFSFTAVPVGDYDVNIALTGFNQATEKGIHLDPGDQKTIRELKLQPGTETSVTVTDVSGQIAIDSGEQSALITASDIEHLAVEGRDVTELFKILPGFAINQARGAGTANTSYDPGITDPTGALGQYSANGTPVNGLSLLWDGADITDPGNFGSAIQNVNYDQVAEVKVQTSSFTADTARGPIVVNAVGKSGGADFHGSLYVYARYNGLNSADWIQKYTAQPKPGDREVYPGFTIGGPFVLPGTGFNRNRKLTFFIGGEDLAQRAIYAYGNAANAILTALVPTARQRQGDFSASAIQEYLGAGPAASFSNLNPVPVSGPNGQVLTNGNIAPYIDPGGAAIFGAMPLPNVANAASRTTQYNYIVTNLVNENLWQARGRLDFAINEKNKFFGAYSTERGKYGVPQNPYYSARGSLGGINAPGGGLVSPVNSQIGSGNLTTIISPTLTNELQLSGSYFFQTFTPKNGTAAANGYPYQKFFHNGSTFIPALNDYGNDGLPILRLSDNLGKGIFAKKWIRTGGDNVTKVFGKHTIRAGVFYQLTTNNEVALFQVPNGEFNAYYFGETTTDSSNAIKTGPYAGQVHNTGAVGSGSGGNYLANILEGHIGGFDQVNFAPVQNLFFPNFSWYGQDHWRVSTRLTLDLGVRFEHVAQWGDSHQIGIPVFSAANYQQDGANTVFPGLRFHAIDKSLPLSGNKPPVAFVEPRVGLSWDAYGGGNTVVRAGFGLYRSHDNINDIAPLLQPLQGQASVSLFGNTLAGIQALGNTQASVTTSTAPAYDQNVSALRQGDTEVGPRVYTWNAAIDQKLPRNSVMEIAYIGNHVEGLANTGNNLSNINALPIGALYGAQPSSGGAGRTVSGQGTRYPVFAPNGATGTMNNSVQTLDQAHLDAFRPYPIYQQLNIVDHTLYSNYNGLQVTVGRQTGGLRYALNYTWSKALAVNGTLYGGNATDPTNLRNDYQSPPFDRRHIFNATYSYTLGNVIQNRIAGELTNGWEVSGITNLQSGANLSSLINPPNYNLQVNVNVPGVYQGTANNTLFLGTPDVTYQPTLTCNPGAHSGSHQYVNGTCFGVPQFGTEGAYKFPFTAAPVFFQTDINAQKSFRIREKSDILFKVSAFNFINHANTSFTGAESGNPLQLIYNANGPSIGSALSNAQFTSSNFGVAPLRQGRRVLNLNLKYNF